MILGLRIKTVINQILTVVYKRMNLIVKKTVSSLRK